MAWGLVHAAQPPVARDLLRTALQVAARQLVAAFAPAHAARLGTACDGAFVQDTWGRTGVQACPSRGFVLSWHGLYV